MDIGKTRAGTIVEYKPNQTIEEFSQEFINLFDCDKFDTWCMFQWLVVRAKPQKSVQFEEYDWWEARLITIDDLILEECVEKGKSETNTRTSYELVQLGKNMVYRFWRQV